jgi:hypothetical protein
MQTETAITLTVLDCHHWKEGQCIIKISEKEFYNFSIDERRRVAKRNPEYWIFVDTPHSDKVLTGKCIVFVSMDANGQKNYSISKKDDNQINNLITVLQSCPPHLFKCSPELRIIFCEKCGTTKFVK